MAEVLAATGEKIVWKGQTLHALVAVHGYTGQDNAEHKLPALAVSTSSEPLAGSDSAFRGEVGASIESEAHDTTSAVHGERVEAARSVLATRAAVVAALNATGRLQIYGYAPLGTKPTAGEAHFATELRYCFGFGPA